MLANKLQRLIAFFNRKPPAGFKVAAAVKIKAFVGHFNLLASRETRYSRPQRIVLDSKNSRYRLHRVNTKHIGCLHSLDGNISIKLDATSTVGYYISCPVKVISFYNPRSLARLGHTGQGRAAA